MQAAPIWTPIVSPTVLWSLATAFGLQSGLEAVWRPGRTCMYFSCATRLRVQIAGVVPRSTPSVLSTYLTHPLGPFRLGVQWRCSGAIEVSITVPLQELNLYPNILARERSIG